MRLTQSRPKLYRTSKPQYGNRSECIHRCRLACPESAPETWWMDDMCRREPSSTRVHGPRPKAKEISKNPTSIIQRGGLIPSGTTTRKRVSRFPSAAADVLGESKFIPHYFPRWEDDPRCNLKTRQLILNQYIVWVISRCASSWPRSSGRSISASRTTSWTGTQITGVTCCGSNRRSRYSLREDPASVIKRYGCSLMFDC